MNQFKRAQVVMLPHTNGIGKFLQEETSRILLNKTNNTLIKDFAGIHSETLKYQPQHLYIISDDEIKKGDWLYNKNTLSIYKSDGLDNGSSKNWKFKIIATTDSSLSPQAWIGSIGYLSIPQPSQQFIEKYIEDYNKGFVIKDILVEYEPQSYNNRFENGNPIGNPETWGKRLSLKTNTKDNTITIKKLKDSWNREEIKLLLKECYKTGRNDGLMTFRSEEYGFDNWIKDNL